MLRVHCVQSFYDLSDPGTEDLLYEVESVRRFAGLRLTGPLPDETTILHFRHLLERHGVGAGEGGASVYVKRHFGYGKAHYRGLAKNTQRIALLLGFANLLIAERYPTD